MTHLDDRIVLPLTAVTMAANTLCQLVCPSFLGPHDEDCLLPLLDERERLLATTDAVGISPDCEVGGVKCQSCTGCTHTCHPPASRR